MFDSRNKTIAIIGLGYVGLPLAVALARHFDVVGFDIDQNRIDELRRGFDRTNEVDELIMRATSLHVTHIPAEIKARDIYIVTVPTPVANDNTPDLSLVESASITVSKAMTKGAIVVFESTVYPGVTEDICGPILEKYSNLICGKDFSLGYSPERINPGDKKHTVESITKVVAGQTPEVAEQLAALYGAINHNNIFIARDIKTAEAAKVIENTQRDINIAFINEITTIFSHMNISVHDVLEAAGTKWNFLKFSPGLVGGHCIGVDPYYLAYAARQLGCEPEIILAGRRINENMSFFLANAITAQLQKIFSNKKSRILVLGLTFKENVPDLRNTKVVELIRALQKSGYQVDVHDPLACPKEAKFHFDLPLISSFDGLSNYDCVIGAVPHAGYLDFNSTVFSHLLNKPGLIVDIKNIWKNIELPEGIYYWTL